ncbi:odorant receptor 83a-like [Cryptotermes secundus]|uniref:odorant receptor 83a-like n=1 Tax=Cryptotermes secundus TaxID=105785 RepID=UPI001454E135|nr:odorant receptor 83a-like [Cryptotermes secundus]XP_033610349.1 odorant receptor 83a-like [Cryptotermes secundus]
MVPPKKKQTETSGTREKLKNDKEFSANKIQIITMDFLLHVSGLVPPKNATPFIRFLYKIFIRVIFTLNILSLLGQLIAVYVHWGNITVISTIMSYMSGFLLSLLGCVYFLHNKDKFMRLIDLLRNEFVANMNSKYIKCIQFAERQVILSCIYSAPIAISFGLFSIAAPFLSNNTNSNFDNNTLTTERNNLDRLMFVIWLPFAIEDSPQFEIIMVLQAILISFGLFMMAAVDVIFLLLMSHAAAQFKVLCAMLNDMHENVSEVELNRTKQMSPLQEIADFNCMKDPVTSADDITCLESGSGNCGNPSSETRQEKCHVNKDPFLLYLVKCIKYHQALIVFVSHLNEIVSLVTFMRIVNFPLILCMTGFGITQNYADRQQFLKFFCFFVISLVVIGGYSWFGQQVIDESEKVQLAFYSTDWYSQTPGYKSLLPLAMMRASRPLRVNAGVFFDMSLLTFSSLVNASYRYFTMLIQLHDS